VRDRLDGRRAIVTGCARGIGRAIAARLASEGASVLALDIDAQGGRDTAEEFGCEFQAVDVTREDQWQTVDREGVDILVNNAGGLVSADVIDAHDLASWDATLVLNLTSVFLGMRRVLPEMLERGAGSIVNLASVSGMTAQPDAPAYQAAKAGVVMLTRNAAITYGPRGIRVNAVSPSVVRTPALELEPPERLDAFLSRVPLGRPAEPEDIAAAVAYLASDDARSVTGVVLAVDGGYLA
jgi:NAD(P)-dependent dehydrogenase (short-subunit alcohol dehydrogenase family)